MQPYTPLERETTVNTSDGDPLTHITTFQRKFISRLLKNSRITVIEHTEDPPYLRCTVPSDDWNPVSGIKRNTKPLSEERKAALRAQLHPPVVG